MDNKLKRKINDFFKTKPVLRAYLFGSESRNESDKGSDVDILVELDYSKPIGLEFVKMKFELEELIHKKVDLLSSRGMSKYIQPYIDKDKILIYEK
jgi:predicted nucleotidyltransferase